LAEASTSGRERIQVAFSSCSVGVLDERRGAEHDDRAVVDRVVERRAREHEPVEQRHGYADRDPGGQVAQHPARRRAVHVEEVAGARMKGGDDVRAAVDLEPDVAIQRLVEDRVDRLTVVAAALRLAPDTKMVGDVAHRSSRR
jgi:hypothetical protein